MKFVYWFAYYSVDSPSVRYRGQYPLKQFKEKYGIDSFFITPSYKPKAIALFLMAYFSALCFRKRNSVIVIQRVNSNFIYATLLKILILIRNKNTLYDLDDADYLDYPPETIYFFLRNCSKISVGSRELARNLVKYNSNIFINTSPTPYLNICKQKRNELFTVGWIGGFGGGHKKSMTNLFFPSLKNLPFNLKLILLGVVDYNEYESIVLYFSEYKNIQLEIPQNIVWTDEIAIQNQIVSFDIGIATLLDDELHRSKSAFKAKQYLNNGVPVISSDIAENNVFVKNNKNGFLCTTSEDFRKRIIQMYEMGEEEYLSFSVAAKYSSCQFDLKNYCDTLIGNC